MSQVKISEIGDAPSEGLGKQIKLEHPYTHFKYTLALFRVEDKYYVITDECTQCGGSLGRVPDYRGGLFVACSKQECLWNIRRGVCKFDRTSTMPTYKVKVEADGLYIDI